jgi:hypothetical protein
MRKALIVEELPCHQEIIPSWIWALTKCGMTVELYLGNRLPQHRSMIDVMRTSMNLSFEVLSQKPHNVGQQYEVIVNNSVYPEQQKIPHSECKRLFSVLHTLPERLSNGFSDYGVLRSTTHRVIALGPHMLQSLQSPLIAMPSVWAPPIYFGDQTRKLKNDKPDLIVVQGTMERFRRNYDCIAHVLNSDIVECNFQLIGDGQPRQIQELMTRLKAIWNGKRGSIRMRTNVPYDQYFSAISEADWIMPCVDETFEHGYFERKITSSVMMAVGHAVPLILHQRLANIYDLENEVHCLSYETVDELPSIVQQATTMSSEQHSLMATNMERKRQEWLQQLQSAFFFD